MKKNEKSEEKLKYNIGLDIGNASVGWAVIDDDNNVMKLNSKRHMWGVRLFEEANSAKDRRMFRSNTRRMKRRKERIRLLRDLMKDDVESQYKDFYDALNLSKYHKGDYILANKTDSKKYRESKYNIFNDEDYTDKKFYTDYKTIYHLRNDLINSTEKKDIRLIYLAIHHIIKYRGNFLYEGEFKANSINEIQPKLIEVLKFILKTEMYDYNITENIFEILKNNKLYKKEKVEQILSKFVVEQEIKKKLKTMFELIVGFKKDIGIIFEISEKKLKLTEDYDESEIEELLGENIEYFNNIKDLNSWYTLQNILSGSRYISEAFMEKYYKYQKDLKLLKKIYKKYLPQEYNNMFKIDKEKDKYRVNYKNYNEKRYSQEDFLKELKKEINAIEFPEKEDIIKDIDNENFLVRLNNRDNGAIPYQLHKIELERILDNQSKYYETLRKNKDKIISILTFRIPYYVGPLHNDPLQPNNWSIRKEGMENAKVLPWNFEDVIDKEASANEFIRRMTNKCTYLPDEDVIPKNSLLYSEFCVLNELNNIRCDKNKLTKEEKELILEELFKKNKNIKEKKLREYLTIINNKKIDTITGFQKEDEFASSLTSYIDFTKLLGKVDDSNREMIETIIEWITIFEDKDILKSKLNNLESLTEQQKNEILKLKYSGWSKLSRKLLTEIKYTNEYNKSYNIMDLLRDMEDNFMQIITDKKYGFDKIIQESQRNIQSKIIDSRFYKDNVANISGSPAIKRGIWQTIKITSEIIKTIGCNPENIYIEFAREDQESMRTSSRRIKLQKSYDEFCKENSSDINKNIINDLKNKDLKITDRLYLYYTQNGKCMYCDKALEIDSLELYQVDHIIPQCKIKDDSFDNKVLVHQGCNQRKLDGFLSNDIVDNKKVLWNKLFKSKLISQIKYFNLLNNKESDKRNEGFIKRQLVETRQITKYVANILQNLYEDSNICAIKAQLGHDFREKYDVFKIRELNEYHHIHDAYINAVIGSYINKKYPKMLKEFVYSDYIKEFENSTSREQVYNGKNKYGFIVGNMGKEYLDSSTGEIISEDESKKQICNVLKQLDIKDAFVTKKLEEQTGAFYNQNALDINYVKTMSNPLKLKEGLDPAKYGAYAGEISAYNVLFEYVEKGNKHLKIEGVPVKLRNTINDDKEKIKEYLEKDKSYSNVKILKSKILKNQLIYKNGKPYCIVSSGEIVIAKQLFLTKAQQLLLYVILNDKNIKSKQIIKAYNLITNELKDKYKETIDRMDKYITNNNEKLDSDKRQHFEDRNIVLNWVRERASEEIYDILTQKIKEEYFDSIGLKLKEYKDNMLKLDLDDKVKVIKLLLTLTSGNSIDLKVVGGKSSQGRMSKINMNEKWLEDVKIVEQSVTGMYEKRLEINELENSDNI